MPKRTTTPATPATPARKAATPARTTKAAARKAANKAAAKAAQIASKAAAAAAAGPVPAPAVPAPVPAPRIGRNKWAPPAGAYRTNVAYRAGKIHAWILPHPKGTAPAVLLRNRQGGQYGDQLAIVHATAAAAACKAAGAATPTAKRLCKVAVLALAAAAVWGPNVPQSRGSRAAKLALCTPAPATKVQIAAWYTATA